MFKTRFSPMTARPINPMSAVAAFIKEISGFLVTSPFFFSMLSKDSPISLIFAPGRNSDRTLGLGPRLMGISKDKTSHRGMGMPGPGNIEAFLELGYKSGLLEKPVVEEYRS